MERHPTLSPKMAFSSTGRFNVVDGHIPQNDLYNQHNTYQDPSFLFVLEKLAS